MKSIANSINPVYNIRTTCNKVVELSSHVALNIEAIKAQAESMSTVDLNELRNGVTWDSCGWHYDDDINSSGILTCQYVFVLDSLNFCFWPTNNLQYDTLAICLRDALRRDPTCFDAEKLANIDQEVISSWFPPEQQLPNMIERVRSLQELGQILIEEFDGLALNLVKIAKNSAVKLVQLLIRYLPNFRDTAIYKGFRVEFYKRAQILVGDVWAAFGRLQTNHPCSFHDIDQLTMFADYRVPQILRELNIICYNKDLSYMIENNIEIPFGSEYESEIRAITVIAVELLHAELVKKGVNILVIELDWLLWQRAENMRDNMKPHHRTKTIYY